MQRELVEIQLRKMLESATLRRKPRTSSFLRHIVTETLDGRAAKLKEYSIALAVFGRPEDFDPRMDSIVRVEARRLRFTIEQYYASEGGSDPVVISLRKGCYAPEFLPPEARKSVLIGVKSPDQEDVLTLLSPTAMAEHLRSLGGNLGQVFLVHPASDRDITAVLNSAPVSR